MLEKKDEVIVEADSLDDTNPLKGGGGSSLKSETEKDTTVRKKVVDKEE